MTLMRSIMLLAYLIPVIYLIVSDGRTRWLTIHMCWWCLHQFVVVMANNKKWEAGNNETSVWLHEGATGKCFTYYCRFNEDVASDDVTSRSYKSSIKKSARVLSKRFFFKNMSSCFMDGRTILDLHCRAISKVADSIPGKCCCVERTFSSIHSDGRWYFERSDGWCNH